MSCSKTDDTVDFTKRYAKHTSPRFRHDKNRRQGLLGKNIIVKMVEQTSIDKLDLAKLPELIKITINNLKENEDKFYFSVNTICSDIDSSMLPNIYDCLMSLYRQNKSDDEILKETLAIYTRIHKNK